ncbi:oligogalacturonate lyase family protein [Sphingomonas sp. R1]|uniref:oligogalacturonate lyase family protein n=1 Tax=Sphingomonas sp. R1 TaxID=399176 RepID=UPI002225709A|nr:oligogalacturonate lyase family protein [Sphingomonas sp. R1]UYY79446.1 oligogalacturonate lyase family protein [Sphingomonas sp. R1]
MAWFGQRARGLALVMALLFSAGTAAAQPAAEWIDKTTGHRVVRISREAGTVSLYFTQNGFLPQGDRMAVTTQQGIALVDLKTWQMRPLVTKPGAVLLFTGRKSRNVYFAERGRDDAGGPFGVFVADADTGAVRRVATVPGGWIGSINADETLLLGQVARAIVPLKPDGTLARAGGEVNTPGMNDYRANGPDGKPLPYAEAKEVHMNRRLDARVPMEIFTIDLRTGARRVVTASTDWLNHVQFSPTDPQQILYCHEGPWHRVDRLWAIRADGSAKRRLHTRTMNMEIAGHEFFSPDGKWVWYDLQTPRGQVFWLAGVELATGKRRWYHVERNLWSVHYNQAPDASRFSGDGGDPEMVAHAPDGKYLYLFTPNAIGDVAGIHADNAGALIAPGTLDAERLVDMRAQDYRLEPNMIFTPDGRWILFRGNFEGAAHLYAVEVAKAAAQQR